MKATKPIKINVGGEIFTTTKDTLCQSVFLKNLLNSFDNESFVLFIDRDPEEFRHVLRYLRNPKYMIPSEWCSGLDFYDIPQRSQNEDGSPILHISDAYTRVREIRYESSNIREYRPYVNTLKYMDRIVKLYRTDKRDDKSYFKICKVVEEILHICYDFENGPVKRGEILASGRLIFEFGKHIPFPRLLLCRAPFDDVEIVLYGDISEINLAVRVYTNHDVIKDTKHDLEHNLIYSGGQVHSIFFDQPNWCKE